MPKNSQRVIAVIPTFNEERTIRAIINDVRPYVDEVLVVCAKHSTDNTRTIVQNMKIPHLIDNGKGKGAALRTAISHINSGILVFFDADGSHISKDIPKLVKPIQQNHADMVIASRFLGGSMELYGTFDKSLRLFFSISIAQLINWRFNTVIGDTQNGFRAISASVAKKLQLEANIFDIETEMVMKCLKKGYRIDEIPSQELNRKYGKSGISLSKMGPTYIWRVFKNLF